LKNALKKKTDPAGTKAWYKTSSQNGDLNGLDPWTWDILDTNDAPSEIKQ
jgi:hypothetical protein